jgi:hypothetical protein
MNLMDWLAKHQGQGLPVEVGTNLPVKAQCFPVTPKETINDLFQENNYSERGIPSHGEGDTTSLGGTGKPQQSPGKTESCADTLLGNGLDSTILSKPYLTAGGVLGIPFDSDPKYHWWKGGQSVAETRAEVERGFT